MSARLGLVVYSLRTLSCQILVSLSWTGQSYRAICLPRHLLPFTILRKGPQEVFPLKSLGFEWYKKSLISQETELQIGVLVPSRTGNLTKRASEVPWLRILYPCWNQTELARSPLQGQFTSSPAQAEWRRSTLDTGQTNLGVKSYWHLPAM